MAKRYNAAEKTINRLFSKDSMISDELLETKMRSFSKLSISYFMLLTASIIIATLGLLMNASAIVIGSMIISPLTWPMFGLADGAALGNRKRIKANLYILISSIVFSILLAYVLTLFSPLKVVNNEILSRSVPTLLDAVVALTAGAIGILAIVRKNISDTVAGVAVALSLTPPVCVVGISLALGEVDIVKGSFLLLVTNALSITLIAGLILILVHYSWRRKLRMAPRAFTIMLVSLLITAVPLYRLLSKYSLESSSYAVVQTELENYVETISPLGDVQNIRTNLEERSGEDALVVDADVFLPPTATITFQDKDNLALNLSQRVNRAVDLRLRVQTVSLLTNIEDIEKDNSIREIKLVFSETLQSVNQLATIDDLDVSQDASGVWKVSARLSGSSGSEPSEKDIDRLKNDISQQVGEQVEVEVSFTQLIQLKSQRQTAVESLRSEIELSLQAQTDGSELASLNVGESNQNTDTITVRLEIKTRADAPLAEETALELKQIAESALQSSIDFRVRTITFEETSY